MGRFLGITGTPGTGKKTLAPRVARAMGVPCVGLNELLTEGERRGAGGVDPAKLRQRLIKRVEGRCLIFGHMLPDVLGRGDVERVVVLRCDPATLRRRLLRRRYSAGKLASNVEAELIGLVSSLCISRFGRDRVAEFDTTSMRISSSAVSVARILGASGSRGRPVDWVGRYSSAEKLMSLLSDARTDSAFT